MKIFTIKHTGGEVMYRERWAGDDYVEAVSYAKELVDDSWSQTEGKAEWVRGEEKLYIVSSEVGVAQEDLSLPKYKRDPKVRKQIDTLLTRNMSLEAQRGTGQLSDKDIDREMKDNFTEIKRIDPEYFDKIED